VKPSSRSCCARSGSTRRGADGSNPRRRRARSNALGRASSNAVGRTRSVDRARSRSDTTPRSRRARRRGIQPTRGDGRQTRGVPRGERRSGEWATRRRDAAPLGARRSFARRGRRARGLPALDGSRVPRPRPHPRGVDGARVPRAARSRVAREPSADRSSARGDLAATTGGRRPPLQRGRLARSRRHPARRSRRRSRRTCALGAPRRRRGSFERAVHAGPRALQPRARVRAPRRLRRRAQGGGRVDASARSGSGRLRDARFERARVRLLSGAPHARSRRSLREPRRGLPQLHPHPQRRQPQVLRPAVLRRLPRARARARRAPRGRHALSRSRGVHASLQPPVRAPLPAARRGDAGEGGRAHARGGLALGDGRERLRGRDRRLQRPRRVLEGARDLRRARGPRPRGEAPRALPALAAAARARTGRRGADHGVPGLPPDGHRVPGDLAPRRRRVGAARRLRGDDGRGPARSEVAGVHAAARALVSPLAARHRRGTPLAGDPGRARGLPRQGRDLLRPRAARKARRSRRSTCPLSCTKSRSPALLQTQLRARDARALRRGCFGPTRSPRSGRHPTLRARLRPPPTHLPLEPRPERPQARAPEHREDLEHRGGRDARRRAAPRRPRGAQPRA